MLSQSHVSLYTCPDDGPIYLTIITAQDKQSRLLNDPDPGHFSLIRAYHLADFITLMNGFCGFMSVTSSMRYCIDPQKTGNLWAALAFMPFGLFFDFFDGKVARWRNKSSLMGQELDSLADLVSILIARLVYDRSDHRRSPSASHQRHAPLPSACALRSTRSY